MNIQVYGLGYVGTVTAALMADFGHQVIGIDNNLSKVETINSGKSPVSEPGLDEIEIHHPFYRAFIASASFNPDTEESLLVF